MLNWQKKALSFILKKINFGTLILHTPENEQLFFNGRQDGLQAEWHIHSWSTVNYLICYGEIGLGEAYMKNWWSTPDLTTLLMLLNQNEPYFFKKSRLFELFGFLQHKRNSNTKKKAAENIKHHYDLGNNFYKLWLDPSLTYSSGVFKSNVTTQYLQHYSSNAFYNKNFDGNNIHNEHLSTQELSNAQLQKFEKIAKELNLNSQSTVLEIGSGWGALACYLAEKFGCKVVSITLSPSQLQLAQKIAQEKSLDHLVSFIIQDYRNLEGKYDAIVSIEMYEAVGEEYWMTYLKKISDCLNPNGRAVIQGIVINPKIFDYYKIKWDFIQKYIFPGGMLCTPGLFQDLSLKNDLQTENIFFFANSYAQTLKIWQKNFDHHKKEIINQFGDTFYWMWRYYLSYCEAGFLHKKIDVMQVTLKPCLYEKISL